MNRLRDQIADLLAHHPTFNLKDDGYSAEDVLRMADALIRELGLIKVSMSEWDVLNYGWRGHRYVTEWMADE